MANAATPNVNGTDKLSVIRYMNPLTIEAQKFLESIDMFSQTHNYIDPVLGSVLENVVLKIMQFVNKDETATIVDTLQTKLINLEEISNIQRRYVCTKCNVTLGTGPEVAVIHLANGHKCVKKVSEEKPQEKKKPEKPIQLPKKVCSLVKTDIMKFVQDHINVADELKDLNIYNKFKAEFEIMMTTMFPRTIFKVYLFGSRVFGLATVNSDLDIFVDIDAHFTDFGSAAAKRSLQFMEILIKGLRKNCDGWAVEYAVKTARVPILRLTHAKTTTKCDVGFSNGLGYCNSKMINYLFEVQPLARHVAMFLRVWIERAKLTGLFSNYAMILMVIFLFQTKGNLPSIMSLQINVKERVEVGPWLASINLTPRSELNIDEVEITKENLKLYIFKFFEFYSSLTYDVVVVCPFFGQLIEIKEIEGKLPLCYREYVNTNKGDPLAPLQLNKCIIVQDPLQLNHNVMKAIKPVQLAMLKEYFVKTAEELMKIK